MNMIMEKPMKRGHIKPMMFAIMATGLIGAVDGKAASVKLNNNKGNKILDKVNNFLLIFKKIMLYAGAKRIAYNERK